MPSSIGAGRADVENGPWDPEALRVHDLGRPHARSVQALPAAPRGLARAGTRLQVPRCRGPRAPQRPHGLGGSFALPFDGPRLSLRTGSGPHPGQRASELPAKCGEVPPGLQEGVDIQIGLRGPRELHHLEGVPRVLRRGPLSDLRATVLPEGSGKARTVPRDPDPRARGAGPLPLPSPLSSRALPAAGPLEPPAVPRRDQLADPRGGLQRLRADGPRRVHEGLRAAESPGKSSSDTT